MANIISAPQDSSKFMWDMQRSLSKAHRVFIVGPLVVSPLKAVISLVQFVAGFAFLVLYTATCLTCGSSLEEIFHSEKPAWCAAKHTGLGLLSLAYSLGNIFSFGILGQKVEESVGDILGQNVEEPVDSSSGKTYPNNSSGVQPHPPPYDEATR